MIFDIRKLQDISIEEIQLKEKYYKFFIDGDIDNAKKIIEENDNLKSKVLNSENLNKIIDNILLLENKYFDGVENKLNNHLNSYQININNLIYLNNYNSNEQYDVNNFVLYNDEIYYCYKKPNIGTLPTNNNYFIYLGLHGEKARNPLGVKYQGAWSSSKSYNKYDMVVYQNQLFVAEQSNRNKNPSSSIEWSLQMKVEEQAIFISDVEPSSIKYGNIWIEIL